MTDPDDPDRPTVFCDTLEEAIATAMADLTTGGEIHIHAIDCEYDDETDEGCTCEPRVIVRPPTAEA